MSTQETIDGANRKLSAYNDLLDGMSDDERVAEWYKLYPFEYGRCPRHDQTRVRNEIINRWQEYMSKMVHSGKTVDELPDRPFTPPGDDWNRG